MSKTIMTIRRSLLAVALLPWIAAPTAAALAIGDKAPMATAKLQNPIDGKDTTIAKAAGPKGTLVVFTCNHCPYAQAWEERIVAIGNAYSKKGVGVIAINANDPGAFPEEGVDVMKEHVKTRGFAFPYVTDPTSGIARAFGASVTPEAFLFDKGGKLAYHGTIDDNSREPARVEARYLQDALDAVIDGKPVARPETKGIGCGIKFRK